MSLRHRVRRLAGERGDPSPREVIQASLAWGVQGKVPADSRLRQIVWDMERFLIASSSLHQAGTLTDDEVRQELARLDAAFGGGS